MTLAFVSAFCWSGLDALRKLLADRTGVIPQVVLISLGQTPLFAAWALLYGARVDLPAYVLPAGCALLLNVLANVLFVRAVQCSPLSLTIPFLSLTPVFASLVAMPMLGEAPRPLQWLGIALVVLGALVLKIERGRSLVGSLLAERGSLMMVGVALCWSVTGSLDKLALDHATVAVHALVQTGGVGLSLLLYLALRGRLGELRQLREAGPLVFLMVAFAAGAMGLQLLAIKQIFVGLVETVKRAVGMVMSVALGRGIFGEPLTAKKWASISVMAFGTALLVMF